MTIIKESNPGDTSQTGIRYIDAQYSVAMLTLFAL
jgi:hypothetical protein